MKAKGSTLKRRVITLMSVTVSMLLASGSITAFAYRLDDDSMSRPVPAAPAIPAEAVGSGGGSWLIPLIVALVVLAVSATLIGTVRIYRARARTVAAGA